MITLSGRMLGMSGRICELGSGHFISAVCSPLEEATASAIMPFTAFGDYLSSVLRRCLLIYENYKTHISSSQARMIARLRNTLTLRLYDEAVREGAAEDSDEEREIRRQEEEEDEAEYEQELGAADVGESRRVWDLRLRVGGGLIGRR